jgi:hypothetical protein
MTLEGAYRRSVFRAGPVVARMGCRSASGDAWLAERGARQGAMLTAWNPMSRRHPPGWNERAQVRLRAAARRWPAAEGFSGTPGWQEHNLLLAGDARAMEVLARRFRQAALLMLRRGGVARVCWLTGRR